MLVLQNVCEVNRERSCLTAASSGLDQTLSSCNNHFTKSSKMVKKTNKFFPFLQHPQNVVLKAGLPQPPAFWASSRPVLLEPLSQVQTPQMFGRQHRGRQFDAGAVEAPVLSSVQTVFWTAVDWWPVVVAVPQVTLTSLTMMTLER